MYKMVAIDLDGTMLNSYGEVTEHTKRVLRQTSQKGVEVVIASGRCITSIKSIAEDIESSKYIIAGNGAVIYDRKNDEILYEKYIPKSKVLEIIKICEENSIFYNVYTNRTIISEELRYNVLYYYKENQKKEEDKKTYITIVDSIKKYIEEMKDEKVMKIFICDSTKSIFNSILKKFSNFEGLETLEVSHMSKKVIRKGTVDIPIQYYYTEISMKDVDKWYALEFLMNQMGIKKEEVITIGDNMNDKKMIQESGTGVVMKGSSSDIIEIADYITDDNNNEGVANAIEKYISF